MDYISDSEILSIKQRFGIVGNSLQLINAIRIAIQVAPTEMSVLIHGESGVGKESFSKIIHNLSKRKHGQFIAINCGAIPEGTIDSELFGHEKGSFTGANEMRKGYFEVTDKGTIFLDEISEMPLASQARLLRVLENGEFIKVGSSKVQKTDVRVIAATNIDVLEAVKNKKFREDLYYRLNSIPIYVPPLRNRDNDCLLLFKKFAIDFAEKHRIKEAKLLPDAEKILLNYHFPGNIRQLKNLTEQINILEVNREIDAKTLLKYLPENSISTLPALTNDNKFNDFSEREILYKVLFDLKKDMNEMKKLILNLMKNEQNAKDLIQKHGDLFENIDYNNNEKNTPKSNANTYQLLIEENKHIKTKIDLENENIEDIPLELDESLSIEKKEKELIEKALRKNNHKKKSAAQELGISERTLYRKIKQFGFEND